MTLLISLVGTLVGFIIGLLVGIIRTTPKAKSGSAWVTGRDQLAAVRLY